MITVVLFIAIAVKGYSKSTIFLRVFDIHHTKVAKGKLAGTTDSSLILLNGNSLLEIPCSQIGTIKTHRSLGHKILIPGIVTTCLVTTLESVAVSLGQELTNVFSYTKPRAKDPSIAILSYGLLSGAAIGSISGLVSSQRNPSRTLMVNGKREDWGKIKSALETMYLN